MEIIGENEIRNAISRSGYLLEGRIIRRLVENDYYISPSERYSDPRTGIDREIDIIGLSELIKGRVGGFELKVNHELIIECTNNPQPIVFFEIGAGDKFLSTYEPYASFSTKDEDSEVCIRLNNSSILELTHPENYFIVQTPSVQYCSFTQKKGSKEWMALHPDEVNSMMIKFKDCFEQQRVSFEEMPPKASEFRHVLFRMVWVTSNDLYLATEKNGEVTLSKKDLVFYLHKFSDKNIVRNIMVDVVSEAYFDSYIKLNKEIDKRLVDKIIGNEQSIIDFHKQLGIFQATTSKTSE
ncbi:MAG TPA: hypothetical protein VL443_05525 [Cyclobacteriaceae bacterium]|jgi:hypothetical protein|nr:hypothetical protein [Cyclobacteriaceae bacterium]